MFDFPQPGEIYRSAGFPDVAVVGILEDGIPWEMPYRCPDIVWNPGNDSNLLIVFYVQIMPDDFVMQLHRF